MFSERRCHTLTRTAAKAEAFPQAVRQVPDWSGLFNGRCAEEVIGGLWPIG